jgi:hypothetical protein
MRHLKRQQSISSDNIKAKVHYWCVSQDAEFLQNPTHETKDQIQTQVRRMLQSHLKMAPKNEDEHQIRHTLLHQP